MKNLLARRMIASISMFMAVLLCIETVLSINVYAFQKDSSELEEKKFNLISNVISEDNITLYQYQDEYYISVEDLCDLTRCTYSVEDGVITLIQGFWGAEFDYDEQTFRDGEQIINTHIFKLSGKDNYAIPVLEYLLYFKSSIAYIKDDTLYCTMPEFTAWEALDIDYENTLIDIYELYGGEGYVTFSLTLDILMDFILGDMPANSDMYVKDAYDAALTVNLSKYEAVGQYIEENSSALNSFIDSDKAKDTFELLDGLVEHGSSGMEYFISSYYNLVANDFAETMIYAFDEGKIDTGFYCANKVLEAFEKEDLIKENTEKFADRTSEFLFWTSLAVESAMEIKLHADTDYLLYNVMGSKNVSSLGLNVQDNSYFSIANQYKNESEIAKNNVIEKYAEFLADQMRDEVEKLIEPVVKKVTGLGTASWGFSKDAAVFFVKNFPPTHATIEAFKADIRGLFLSEVQQNVYFVIYKIYQKLSKDWDNEELYKKYIDAELLYGRVSIAMYEDLITRVDEFSGKHDREYWKSVFQNRIDYLAIKMYQLTVFQDEGMSKCCPMDLSAYNVPLVIVIPKDATYILPESDTRIYDVSEIQALTEEELELARNEIFARRGRKFKREDLQEYFEGKSWYEGTIEPDDFDNNTMLSDIEKANLELIRGVEQGDITLERDLLEVKDYLDDYNVFRSVVGTTNQVTESIGAYTEYYVSDGGLQVAHSAENPFVELFDCRSPNVSLYGVYVGQDYDDAITALEVSGWEFVKKDLNYGYVMRYPGNPEQIRYIDITYNSDDLTVTGFHYWARTATVKEDDIKGVYVSTDYIENHETSSHTLIDIRFLDGKLEIIATSNGKTCGYYCSTKEYYIENNVLYVNEMLENVNNTAFSYDIVSGTLTETNRLGTYTYKSGYYYVSLFENAENNNVDTYDAILEYCLDVLY